MNEPLETWQIILIIGGAVGFIGSNIALLKYTSKFEMKKKVDKTINPEFEKSKPQSSADKNPPDKDLP